MYRHFFLGYFFMFVEGYLFSKLTLKKDLSGTACQAMWKQIGTDVLASKES